MYNIKFSYFGISCGCSRSSGRAGKPVIKWMEVVTLFTFCLFSCFRNIILLLLLYILRIGIDKHFLVGIWKSLWKSLV